MNKKIALFHPWIKSRGGAERVVLELLKKSKYDITLFTWVYDEKNSFEEFKKFKINVIAPKFAEKLSRNYLTRSLIFLLGWFKKIPLEKYDKFLISTSGVGEFILFRNYLKGKTFAYSHTPLRDVQKNIVKWNLKNKNYNFLKKQIYLFSVKFYRILERLAWKRLDFVIFNSELSRQRAKEHNLIKGKKTTVIHPPIRKIKPTKSKKGNYFIYISRFNEPKRQEVLLKAWKKFVKEYPNLKLYLVGNPEGEKYYQKLKELAKKNVEFKLDVEYKELRELISGCLAGIFLGYQEDFGMVPLEILFANKPLIATDKGGYVELIKDHPQFYKIKEKHNPSEMVKETKKALEEFMKSKNRKKGIIKIKDFVKEVDKFISMSF